MYRKIRNHEMVSIILLILLLITSDNIYAASCETASGSKCTLDCSVGTLSLSCSSSSKTCSGSCSDSSGNMEVFLANMVKNIVISSEGKVSSNEVIERLKLGIYRDEFMNNDGGIRIGSSYFTIRVGGDAIKSGFLGGGEYSDSLSRIEDAFRGLNYEGINRGLYLNNLHP